MEGKCKQRRSRTMVEDLAGGKMEAKEYYCQKG